ncbi:MAG: HAD family hydrolase [Cellulomonadaceae bacterium]|nr:HAD family hydrolase [Cellulomonadaceae bacterium]
MVDGVLFDVDDTLVDTAGAFASALAKVAAVYLPHLAPGRYPEVLATWRADAGGHYRRYTRGEVDHATQRMARANALHAQFGGPLLDRDGYRLWDDLFEESFASAWVAHDDAHVVLDTLAAAGVAVGALSNATSAYQVGKLRRAGLARVPMLVGVDTFGVGKPDPRVFLEACRLLGTEPARTAYVGDELDIDALGAAAVGLVGVWIDRPGVRRVPVSAEEVRASRAAGIAVVSSLAEVPGRLRL